MSMLLLIIDPQNDFCSPEGALFVPGAPEDCTRTAHFIDVMAKKIDCLCVTMDCHSAYHIAHPIFWKNKNGENPQPFTVINHADIMNEIWQPIDTNLQKVVQNYVLALETAGKYHLTVWPPHCLLGSWGTNIEKNILSAARLWESSCPGKKIDFFYKSSNSTTEHYSAVQAEVPDPEDPTTRTNFELIDKLKNADTVLVAGEALTHCVANTLRDLLAYIPADKITLLTDCSSPIIGFEHTSARLLQDFVEKGMKMCSTTQLLGQYV